MNAAKGLLIMLDAYPPDLRDFVAQKIASGEFKSADEFAVIAAKVYREMDQRHRELKQSVMQGIRDIESGNCVVLNGDDELHEFFEALKREGRKRLEEATRRA
jgi:Arc/MetJ-type ribon-helix-helix transcriptional regulator